MSKLPGFQRCGCAVSTAAFIEQIKAGLVPPSEMADVIYTMHAAMVDRFEAVALWLPVDLEQVADDIVKAIELAERSEQDQPEEVAA